MLIVGRSTPELRVDNRYSMAKSYTYYAHIDISITGTPSNEARDITPLFEKLRRFNTTSLRQLK